MSENENEAEQRAAVVAEARSWIGTRYHNCADVKGAGVDCGMLLVRVFVDTGLCQPFDPRPYPPDWHLHRSEEKYLGFLFDRCHEVFLLPLPERGGGGAPVGVAVAGRLRDAVDASLPGRDLHLSSPFQGEEERAALSNQAPSAAGWGAARREAPSKVQPGDVAVFRFGRCYSHGGIVTEVKYQTSGIRHQTSGIRHQVSGARDRALMPDPRSLIPDIRIVHAYAPARCVVEEPVVQNPALNEAKRVPRFFSYFGNQKSEIGNQDEQALRLPNSDFRLLTSGLGVRSAP